jgi:hypothetical protein
MTLKTLALCRRFLFLQLYLVNYQKYNNYNLISALSYMTVRWHMTIRGTVISMTPYFMNDDDLMSVDENTE